MQRKITWKEFRDKPLPFFEQFKTNTLYITFRGERILKVKLIDMLDVLTGRERCKLCKGIVEVQLTMSPKFGVEKLCRYCRKKYNIKSI